MKPKHFVAKGIILTLSSLFLFGLVFVFGVFLLSIYIISSKDNLSFQFLVTLLIVDIAAIALLLLQIVFGWGTKQWKAIISIIFQIISFIVALILFLFVVVPSLHSKVVDSIGVWFSGDEYFVKFADKIASYRKCCGFDYFPTQNGNPQEPEEAAQIEKGPQSLSFGRYKTRLSHKNSNIINVNQNITMKSFPSKKTVLNDEINWEGCTYGEITCREAFNDSFTGKKIVDYVIVAILIIITIIGIIMAIDWLVIVTCSSAQIDEEEEEEEEENEGEYDDPQDELSNETSGNDEFHPHSHRHRHHRPRHHHHHHHRHHYYDHHSGRHHRHRRHARYISDDDLSDN